jgi:predicted translin family RNA/ssDNA-binding protein
VRLRRHRFADVISRQLDLFEREEADLIRQCDEAENAYDRAEREEAEELYGDYIDLVESGTEALADLRWAYAATLDEEGAEEYEEAFNQAVKKRLPRFGLEIDLR